MRKQYGPWVRHDWCHGCWQWTEQTRWFRQRGSGEHAYVENVTRCHECGNDPTLARSLLAAATAGGLLSGDRVPHLT